MKVRAIITLLCVSCFATILSIGCSSEQGPASPEGNNSETKSITGTIVYRERMMIPPNSTIQVILEDVSKMDIPSTVISEITIPAQNGPPYPFTLEYDAAAITEQNRYNLRARIEANDQLLFISSSHIPPFETAEGEPVEILVQRVGGTGSHKVDGKALATLTNTRWKVLELNGALAGQGAGSKDLHITLTDEGAHGFSGCNSFRGSFETENDQLSFGPLAVTSMACSDGEVIERRFLSALEATTHYKIMGETLMLLDGNGRTMILCEALYL